MRFLLTISAVAASFLAICAPTNAFAASYSSCAALHVKYPNGVAKDQTSIDNASGLNGTPAVNKKVYLKVYKNLDRDRDGIACEV
jgi:hypothetical protein